MHLDGCFLVRRVDQAEDTAGTLIVPIMLVVHAVFMLHGQIFLVRFSQRFRRNPFSEIFTSAAFTSV